MSGLERKRKRGSEVNSDNPFYWKIPTQERVRFLFDYRVEDGELIRKNIVSKHSNAKVGEVVKGGYCTDGYKQIYVDGRYYLVHRIIFLWHHGYIPENQIDHINQNRKDNRIENLREVSIYCNARNRKTNSENTTRVKGVTVRTRHGRTFYTAMIRIDDVLKHLGDFDDKIEAVAHRLAVEQCEGWYHCDVDSPAYRFLKQQGIIKC